MKNPVGWFEIPVQDMDRAKKFYGELLGLPFEYLTIEGSDVKMLAFPMQPEAPQATGALVHGPGYSPSLDGVVIYFTAAELEAMLEKVPELGGEVLLPKTDIGEHGFMAHIKDTEGNRVALHRVKTDEEKSE